MTSIARILQAIEDGDPLAAEQLLPLVCDESTEAEHHQHMHSQYTLL